MKKYIIMVQLLSVLLILPSFIMAQENNTMTLTLRDASLHKVLKILADKTGKNLIADPSLKNVKVNVDLTDVPVEEAMDIILETNRLGIRRTGESNIYIVDNLERILSYTVIKSVSVQYADAVELQGTLSELVSPDVGTILADARTNTLIIKENPRRLEKILSLIETLDRPTYQVSIQAAIIEISRNADSEVGIEWLWKDPNYKNIDGKATTLFGDRANSVFSPYVDNLGDRIGLGLPKGDGIGIGIVNAHVDVVLKAIASQNQINLLSRPRLVTLDNQEAEIEVGDQIPFRVLNQFGVTSTEFKNASVLLKVKPHVNNDRTVTLHIEPHADFQNGVTFDGTPIIATRRADTKIKVNSGSTVIIGGLMRTSKSISEIRVPILSRIPIISFLFKKKVTNEKKTELVILVMPHILGDDSKLIEVSSEEELIEKMKERF